MIKGAEKEDGIERSDIVRRKVVDVSLFSAAHAVLETKRLAAEVEGLPLFCTTDVMMLIEAVGKVVDGQNLRRAAPQGFECPIAVPGADIENALSTQGLWNAVACRRERRPSRCDDPSREFNTVILIGNRLYLCSKFIAHRRFRNVIS